MRDEFGNKITEDMLILPERKDSGWQFMESVEGSVQGGTALVVLGGNSGSNWQAIYDSVKPDVLIGANGAIAQIDNLDYWIMTENINGVYKRAARQNCRKSQKIVDWTRIHTPKHRLVHHISYSCIRDKSNVHKINRWGFDLDETHLMVDRAARPFSIRRYGLGFISGDLMRRPHIVDKLRVGTVGLQSMHLAALLGCSRIITIGYDLCFKEGAHHWYKDDIKYEANTYWGDNMFTVCNGLPTLWFWVDTADYMRRFNEKILLPAGIKWQDKSDGLLQSMRVIE